MAASSKDDLCLSTTPPSAKRAQPSPRRDLSSWGDIMDVECPEFTPLFDQQLLEEGDEVEGDDQEMLANLLCDEPYDEKDETVCPSIQTCDCTKWRFSIGGGGL